MKCVTDAHEGVCHRTLNPYKSANKINRGNKKSMFEYNVCM